MASYTLSEQINLTLISNYSNTNKEWIQFIFDHYELIKENSTLTSISDEDMYIYQYRLEDYLSSISVDKNISWIVLFVNQLGNNRDFKELKNLFIPNMTYINKLYSQYQSNNVNKELIDNAD